MKKAKIITDVGMYAVLLLLMSEYQIKGLSHECLGIAFGVLFIMHTVLNRKWYSSLIKGRYNAVRALALAISSLLLIFTLCSMISGMLVSQRLFAFTNGSAIEAGRKLHLLSTAWLFLLSSFHMGMHLKFIYNKRLRKWFRAALCIILSAGAIYGILTFVERRMWEELFLMIEFQKSFDSSIDTAEYIIGSLAVTVMLALLGMFSKAVFLRTDRSNEKN